MNIIINYSDYSDYLWSLAVVTVIGYIRDRDNNFSTVHFFFAFFLLQNDFASLFLGVKYPSADGGSRERGMWGIQEVARWPAVNIIAGKIGGLLP